MKPFNLERALAGDKVITRDGTEIIELHHFKTAKNQSVCAIINGFVSWHGTDGSHYYYTDGENNNDLFMESLIKVYWVNVYRDKDEDFITGAFHSSQEKAFLCKNDCHKQYIKTITIEIEE